MVDNTSKSELRKRWELQRLVARSGSTCVHYESSTMQQNLKLGAKFLHA